MATTAGAFQPALKPQSQNAFVVKFNSLASALIYSTYLGGSKNDLGGTGEDEAHGIALDPAGNATVIGSTDSVDFPLTPGALYTQNTAWINSGDTGSFLSKLNSTGTALLYSTYFSGSGDLTGETCDCANAIAADSSGNLYLTGATVSTDFPTTLGAFQTSPSGPYVTKFNIAEMMRLSPTTTTVLANPISQAAGSPVAFTVTVKGTGTSTPTGSVGVSVNGHPWRTYSLDQTGSVSYTTTSLPAGLDTVVTYYLGDANNAPSTNYLDVSISSGSGLLPTTINVVPSANPVPYGTPVTFSVTVQDPSGKGTPVGTVKLFFVANWQSPFTNQVLDQVQLDAQGHASLTTKSLPAGTQNLTIGFQPSDKNYAYTSYDFTEDVTPLGAAAPPTLSLAPGTYPSAQTLTITDATPGVGLYYTIGNGNPSIYYNPLNISASETISVYASGAGYSNSPTVTATYTIGPPAQAPTPSISPASGSYSSAQQVSITDSLSGAAIYYTTNGSAPTTSSTLYSGPFAVSASTTVQAIAAATGYSASNVATVTYTITLPPADFSISLASPSLTLSHGQSVTTTLTMTPANGFSQSVSFSCSGLPAGVSCDFLPGLVSAGSPTTTLKLTAIALAGTPTRPDLTRFAPVVSLAFLICWAGVPKRLRKGMTALVVVISASFVLLSGCGGSKSAASSPPVTTNATITATSGSLSHTASFTVTLN
jgi:hypothetical protein